MTEVQDLQVVDDSVETHGSAKLGIIKGGRASKEMIIGGIISTDSVDLDDEMIDPKGVNLDYFIKSGILNYDHQKGVRDVVGAVRKAEKRGNGIYAEFVLFDTETGREVYALVKAANKAGHSMGFSIEGLVHERDSANIKKIVKATFTACAITPSPKNSDAIVSLIKSNRGEFKVLYKGIIDVKEDEEEKSLSTVSGAPLMPESLLDKKKRRKTKKSLNLLHKKLSFTTIKSWSDFLTIDSIFDTTSLAKSLQLYNFLLKSKNNE